MSITLNKALKIGGLAKGEVIAGINGLNNIVDSINVLEIPDSKIYNQITNWIIKNELYITAFYAIKDDPTKQVEAIQYLSDYGASGIILFHVGYSMKEVNIKLIDICEKLNFPLIVVPSDMAYKEILFPVMDYLLKNNSFDLKFSLDIQEKLDALILEDKNINDICKSIEYMFKCDFHILDTNHYYLSGTEIVVEEKRLIEEYCKKGFKTIFKEYNADRNIFFRINKKEYLLYPIFSGNSYFGMIVCTITSENRSKILLTIRQIGITIALISTKKIRANKMISTYMKDFVSDLIIWNFRNEDIALSRARSIGWEIENKVILIIINVNSIDAKSNTNEPLSDIAMNIEKKLYPHLYSIVKEENQDNEIGYRSDMLIILIHEENEDSEEKGIFLRVNKLSENICKLCSRVFEGSISIGISDRIHNLPEISKAYNEAFNAVVLGRYFFGENKWCEYRQLGFIPLLKVIASDDGVIDRINFFLGPLLEYDEKYGSDLLKTLEYLLQYNMDTRRTAETLFVHKNTVLYRKNKIIEILGFDPFSDPFKLNYSICFMIKNLNYYSIDTG